MTPWLLAIPLTVAVLAAVFFWRRLMNMKESFEKTIADNLALVERAREMANSVPALIKEAEQNAVAKYIEKELPPLLTAAGQNAVAEYLANNPPAEGPTDIDGVTYADLVDWNRKLADDQRALGAQIDAVPQFFENNKVLGDPRGGA